MPLDVGVGFGWLVRRYTAKESTGWNCSYIISSLIRLEFSKKMIRCIVCKLLDSMQLAVHVSSVGMLRSELPQDKTCLN